MTGQEQARMRQRCHWLRCSEASREPLPGQNVTFFADDALPRHFAPQNDFLSIFVRASVIKGCLI